jgi:hypothetical protein
MGSRTYLEGLRLLATPTSVLDDILQVLTPDGISSLTLCRSPLFTITAGNEANEAEWLVRRCGFFCGGTNW